MTLKEVLSSALVIALGLILIVHFTLFWIYGGVFIYESNKIILSLETLMSVTIIGFGIERLVSSSNRKYKQEAASAFQGKVRKLDLPEHLTQPNQDYRQQERRQVPQALLQQQ